MQRLDEDRDRAPGQQQPWTAPSSSSAAAAPSRPTSAGRLDVIGSTGSLLLPPPSASSSPSSSSSGPAPSSSPCSACSASRHPRCSRPWLRVMAREGVRKLQAWLLEVEMGVVWGVAGTAIILFVFAAIWYIDPALLTLVLQFRQATCTTENSAFLVGISNCSWTSCRLGCTREVYKCWQVQVSFEFEENTRPYKPPWASLSEFERGHVHDSGVAESEAGSQMARLYPNVRGCGYPPELNCEDFFKQYGEKNSVFQCWVSTMDRSIAMTDLNLEQAKEEVIYSLIPLLIFILSVLYAFCRLGVFSICNPFKMCPKPVDTAIDMPALTPKKLYEYKKGLVAKKNHALASFQASSGSGNGADANANASANAAPDRKLNLAIPATIQEDAHSEALSPPRQRTPAAGPKGSGANATRLDQPRSRQSAGASAGGAMYHGGSPLSASYRRSSPAATPTLEHHPQQQQQHQQRAVAGLPIPLLVKQKDYERSSTLALADGGGVQHEMLDLKEFDLTGPDDDDDIVSIRSMGSAVRGSGATSRFSANTGGQGSRRGSPHQYHLEPAGPQKHQLGRRSQQQASWASKKES